MKTEERITRIREIRSRLESRGIHYLEREKLEKELHELKAKEEEQYKDQHDFLDNLLKEEAVKLEKETLRYWQDKAAEAEQKMMKAKSKQTVKKWSRELQVCGMNIRELERNIKNLKGEEKEEMRKILLENLIIEARKVPYPFGISVKKHNLTSEEKRWLADKGLHLHGPGRHKSMILLYPQELRVRDIKEKVYKKRRGGK